MNKIAVGVVCPDYIATKTVGTLISLMKSDQTLSVIIKQGCYVHKNREDVVLDAQKGGFTHLFFVDADMCFSPLVLQRLLSHDKDIVGGVYHYRRLPKEPVVRFVDENGEPTFKEIPKEPFKCFALGTGCLLIKMSVFDKLKRPWFWFGDGKNQIGEDLWFCKSAQESGYEIWADPTIEIGHVGEYIF